MLARQIAVGFGIAIVFPLLIYYGVSTFHPAPERRDFFPVTTQPARDAPQAERQAYEEQQQARREAYNRAAKEFSRVLSFVAIPLGALAILIGAYLANAAIGTGLIFGGIFAVVWGYWSYWFHLDDWFRFASLAIGFAVLLFVGFFKLKPPKAPPAS